MPTQGMSEAIYELVANLPADGLPPALRTRFEDAVAHWFEPREPLTPWRRSILDAVLEAGEGDLAGCAELEALGHALLAPECDPSVRRWACVFLTHFPSVETVTRLAAILADDTLPDALRSQAAWTLGFRQLQTRHPAVHFEPAAVRIADEALRAAVEAELTGRLPELSEACRHVADPALHDSLLDRPVLAAEMIDAFCSPKLAARLLEELPSLPVPRRPAVVRVVASTLGEACAATLIDRARPLDVTTRQEALFAAFRLDPHRFAAPLDEYIASLQFPGDVQARREYCLRRPGESPLLAATRLARTSATIPPGERVERMAPLVTALAEANAAGMLRSERMLTSFWCHLAYATRDVQPDGLASAVAAAPDIADDKPHLAQAYLESLAAAGRYVKLAQEGMRLDRIDEAAWLLARGSRPFLALRASLDTRRATAKRVAAEAVALTLAGRPDLGRRTLEHIHPEAEFLFGTWDRQPFPGPVEAWQRARGGEAGAMITAVADRALDPLLSLVRSPPPGADRDAYDFGLLRAFDSPRGTDLQGARVLLVGRFTPERRRSIAEALVARGAQLVDAAFGGTDRYVVGEEAPPELLHRLFRSHARPLAPADLDLEDAS